MRLTRFYFFLMMPFLLVHCKGETILTTKMGNVMCRERPDIKSRVVEIFPKGQEVRGRKTDIKFTFMEMTDVWHEIPEYRCYIFGGLLNSYKSSESATDKVWRIQVDSSDPRGDNRETSFRPGTYTLAECKKILADEEADYEAKRAEVDRRGGNCGEYPTGCHFGSTTTCVHK